MRVRGHQCFAGAFGLIGKCRNQLYERLLNHWYPAPKVQAQVERYLLVARPTGMEPPAGIADALNQLPFDKAVDVLICPGDERRIAAPFFKNRFKTLSDRRSVLLRQHAARAERLRPCQAAGDIVFEQGAVETERNAEIEGRRIGLCVETAGPESHE